MANAIVLEVLEFVRPIRLQVERVSLADAIRDAVTLSESHGPRAGVRVDVSLPADLPAIQGDPHQLKQIVTNLLINAYEAMNGKGAVAIAATILPEDDLPGGGESTTGPMIQVEVKDDGPGMPPEVLDKIFSPFFTTKPQGSGLGLAIVRKIVDAHDGRIDVSAAAGGRDALPRHAAGVGESRVVQALADPGSRVRERQSTDGSKRLIGFT